MTRPHKVEANPEPDLSHKIREAEFKNIIQKLKDGKTLSAREAKMANEFAKEREQKPDGPITQVALAKAWGMTQPNISYLCKQGMPLTSIEAASEWRRDYLEKQGRGADAPASLNDARLRKILLECERIELANAISRSEYVSIGAVRESGIRIGAIFSAKLAALVNDASGALAGLGEAELRKKLHERTQQILSEIREELEKL
jgi:hypothetical protein